MKKFIITAAFLASFSVPTMAEGKPGSGPNPFSDCGIGAALFKNNVAATISNVIWDIGITAVTSATASPETCNGKEVVAAAFIFESYEDLVAETVQGQGEHFESLMHILQVAQSDRSDFAQVLRADMAELLANDDYIEQTRVEKAQALFSAVIQVTS